MVGSMTQSKPVVIVSSNSAWSIVNFRANLVKELMAQGYRVVTIANADGYEQKLADMGIEFYAINIDPQSKSLLKEMRLLANYLVLFRKLKPSAYLGFTIKPNIFGSLAAQVLRIPTINNISGLGSVFIRKNLTNSVVKLLYRFSLLNATCVFFQNPDDRQLFVGERLVKASKTKLLPGSGVDLKHFFHVAANVEPHALTFLQVGRVLADKGINEFIAAARAVKHRFPDIEFQLLGAVDVENPSAISRAEVESWVAEGVITYLGKTDDVRFHIANADCIVLPSYREGVPRSLLEAASIGRTIVTTDVPGCREAVEHGQTGFLCRSHDAADLAAKFFEVINLSPDERRMFGQNGRERVERLFSENTVIQVYIDTLSNIFTRKRFPILEP
jgi:glycosyltransferase involved in cell wall biosynthesis